MNKLITLAAVAAAAAACAPAAPLESPEVDARLAEALEGRVAGEPVACIDQVGLRGTRSFGDEAIVMEGRGGVLYVNRPPGGCPILIHGRSLRTRTPVARLCRGDIVTVFDPVSGIEYGGCGLGDFVPYRRPV